VANATPVDVATLKVAVLRSRPFMGFSEKEPGGITFLGFPLHVYVPVRWKLNYYIGNCDEQASYKMP
jgi:hypothetical protein